MEQNNRKEKAGWEKMKTANVLGITISFLSFAFLFSLLFIEVPKENVQLVSIIVGFVIGTGFAGLMAYFFNYRKEHDQPNDLMDPIVFKATCDNCGTELNN